MIEHSGTVISISEHEATVLIAQSSACSGCHAKQACTSADVQEKKIIADLNGNQFQIGDLVTIIGKKTIGLQAVLLAFVIPFLLILTALFIFDYYHINEGIAGLIALAILLPYYFILSRFESLLKQKLKFYLTK